MTRRPFGLLLLLVGVGAPLLRADTYARQPAVDVLHYTFALRLSDASDTIQGETTVEWRALADGVSFLELDLAQPSAETPARGMTVQSVSEAGAGLSFRHEANRLHVTLARPATRDERRSLQVRYGGILIGPNTHGDRSFFSDNWPTKAHQWLPVVDHPYDKATGEFVITAPDHYQVVANGLLVEESDLPDGLRLTRWRQSVPIAVWLYTLGVARFAVDHRPAWRGRPIQTWVYPQDRDAGFHAFAEPTRAVLDFFEERIGPFAYEKLAHVQSNSVKGGMESATAIFYGDDSVTSERGTRWRNVQVHEIAHQWFGDAVTESDWDDVWLSEGFATYFTLLFAEHRYGRDEFVAGLESSRKQVLDFDAQHPDYRIVHDNLADMKQVLTPQIYQKGAWTLHMLRGLVGDATFWAGIRDYYARHRDQNASTADFRRAMEEASRQDLGWFFEQWLYRGGVPKLRGRWRWDPAAKALRVELEQTQPGAPYQLPLELGVRVADETEPRLERLVLRERRQAFTLALAAAPESVVFDPSTRTLAAVEFGPAR
jgi:aminopeptidase N